MAARAPHGSNVPPKIIYKKVYIEGHGGHHGGAWKVAYADFVTAMMAFFLLLWLLGATDEKQRKGIADYFAPTLVDTHTQGIGGTGPLGGLLEQKVEDGSKELQCIKTTLLASMQGYAPQVAIEFGRKVLYSPDRPSFTELEAHVKGKK